MKKGPPLLRLSICSSLVMLILCESEVFDKNTLRALPGLLVMFVVF